MAAEIFVGVELLGLLAVAPMLAVLYFTTKGMEIILGARSGGGGGGHKKTSGGHSGH